MANLQRRTAAKDAILSAAITLFAERGFEGTSFSDITELCGAKRSLILYHYGSKEELWRRAVQNISLRFNDEMKARLEIDDTASDAAKVRASTKAFIDTLVAVPEFGQILLREGTTPGPRIDWIAQHFAPPVTLTIHFKDKALEHKIKRTVLRDVFIATSLAIVTLGPLLEVSLAAALKRSAGVYPLTAAKRDEVIDLMMKLAFG